MYQVTATHKTIMRMRMSMRKEMQRLKQGRKVVRSPVPSQQHAL